MRIQIFGGSGCGKSTLCADIYARLKQKHVSIEMVREGKIKDMAYKDEPPSTHYGWASWHIFSEHLEREDFFLHKGCNIVTDCPGFLSYIYAHRHGFKHAGLILEAALAFDKEWPSVNLFIERDDKHYQDEGRYQDLAEAKVIDGQIQSQLKFHNIKYKTFNVHEAKAMATYLLWYLHRHELGNSKRKE